MRQNVIYILLLSLVFFACKKDKPNTPTNTIPIDTTNKVLMVCEGSLGNGNASLSVYYPAKDSVYNDVYAQVNTAPLGDVFQGVIKVNQQYFLSINNSDKMLVVGSTNYQQQQTIYIPKPRYALLVSNSKMYVGSLFSNVLSVLNPATYLVAKQITMPFQNVEGMLLQDSFAYICCWDTACHYVYKINTQTDKIIDSIGLVGAAPHQLCLDKEGRMWVLAGNAPKHTNASLTCIDINKQGIVKSFVFAADVEAIKPCFNPAKDSLYFIEVNYSGATMNNGIYCMPIAASVLPFTPFISCQANQYYWALGIDAHTGLIYVGDPKGFVQQSSVSVYSPQANLLHRFTVGLGISSFYFD
jgi:hypothetical protein